MSGSNSQDSCTHAKDPAKCRGAFKRCEDILSSSPLFEKRVGPKNPLRSRVKSSIDRPRKKICGPASSDAKEGFSLCRCRRTGYTLTCTNKILLPACICCLVKEKISSNMDSTRSAPKDDSQAAHRQKHWRGRKETLRVGLRCGTFSSIATGIPGARQHCGNISRCSKPGKSLCGTLLRCLESSL